MKTVLAIGGWDPTSGAGITADVKAVHACGAYCLTALTGLAIQTPHKMLDVQPVKPKVLRRTLDEALTGLPIGAVKTGMLGGRDLAKVAFSYVRNLPAPWVYDPVRASSDGTPLGKGDLKHALPREALTVVTPNLVELEELTGVAVTGRAGRDKAVAALFGAGFEGVLVKGGHGRGAVAGDELVLAGGGRYYHERPRYAGSLHGSGCTLASALAAFLAQGADLAAAFYQAEMFMDAVFAAAWDAGKRRRLSVLPQGTPAGPRLLR